MSAIGPGDWVECIDAKNGARTGFQVGALYCVTEVGPFRTCGRCGDNCIGFNFANMRRPDPYRFWAGCAFRPVYRPNADLIRSLQQPVPADLVEA